MHFPSQSKKDCPEKVNFWPLFLRKMLAVFGYVLLFQHTQKVINVVFINWSPFKLGRNYSTDPTDLADVNVTLDFLLNEFNRFSLSSLSSLEYT